MFARFSLGSADIADDDLILIERFVLFYDKIGSTTSIKGACWLLFTKKGRSSDNCPQTLNTVWQHIYCSTLQSSS